MASIAARSEAPASGERPSKPSKAQPVVRLSGLEAAVREPLRIAQRQGLVTRGLASHRLDLVERRVQIRHARVVGRKNSR